MDKQFDPLSSVGEIKSIPKFHLNKLFLHILYWQCDYLVMVRAIIKCGWNKNTLNLILHITLLIDTA